MVLERRRNPIAGVTGLLVLAADGLGVGRIGGAKRIGHRAHAGRHGSGHAQGKQALQPGVALGGCFCIMLSV